MLDWLMLSGCIFFNFSSITTSFSSEEFTFPWLLRIPLRVML